METYMKPKIIISKCIEHDACRYDGSMITSDFVKRIQKYVEFITVCPEVESGLSIPREAIRLIKDDRGERLVTSMSGEDCTNQMTAFINEFIKGTIDNSIHGAILKSRSPSCGIKSVKVYSSHGRLPCLPKKSKGFFASAIIEELPFLPLEDEGRLLNYDIREHFLTRIFTLASFEKMAQSLSLADLVSFHSCNKYLLMAYHQTEQKKLGRIVANHEHLPVEDILIEYRNHLRKALVRPLKKGKNTNMILHMFGYVSNDLTKEEKVFFLDQLSLYNQNKKPLSSIMTLLYGWVIRFNVSYLKMQTIFKPYPIEILDVMDSGKGIQ